MGTSILTPQTRSLAPTRRVLATLDLIGGQGEVKEISWNFKNAFKSPKNNYPYPELSMQAKLSLNMDYFAYLDISRLNDRLQKAFHQVF